MKFIKPSVFQIKLFFITLLVVIISGVIFKYTLFNKEKPKEKPQVNEVIVLKNKDNTVKRDYKKMTPVQIKQKLNEYDKTPMIIDYTIVDKNKKGTTVDIDYTLGDRSGEQTVIVPVAQSGNWKFYVGIGVGSVVVGGLSYGIYKLVHRKSITLP